MPVYQLWCDNCHLPFEVLMKLKTLEEFDKGKKQKQCPECNQNLRKLICPPKIVKIG